MYKLHKITHPPSSSEAYLVRLAANIECLKRMTNKFLKMVVQGLVMLNSIQESNLDSNKLAKTKA